MAENGEVTVAKELAESDWDLVALVLWEAHSQITADPVRQETEEDKLATFDHLATLERILTALGYPDEPMFSAPDET